MKFLLKIFLCSKNFLVQITNKTANNIYLKYHKLFQLWTPKCEVNNIWNDVNHNTSVGYLLQCPERNLNKLTEVIDSNHTPQPAIIIDQNVKRLSDFYVNTICNDGNYLKTPNHVCNVIVKNQKRNFLIGNINSSDEILNVHNNIEKAFNSLKKDIISSKYYTPENKGIYNQFLNTFFISYVPINVRMNMLSKELNNLEDEVKSNCYNLEYNKDYLLKFIKQMSNQVIGRRLYSNIQKNHAKTTIMPCENEHITAEKANTIESKADDNKSLESCKKNINAATIQVNAKTFNILKYRESLQSEINSIDHQQSITNIYAQSSDDKNLIEINQKVFDDLENTLKTVKILKTTEIYHKKYMDKIKKSKQDLKDIAIDVNDIENSNEPLRISTIMPKALDKEQFKMRFRIKFKNSKTTIDLKESSKKDTTIPKKWKSQSEIDIRKLYYRNLIKGDKKKMDEFLENQNKLIQKNSKRNLNSSRKIIQKNQPFQSLKSPIRGDLKSHMIQSKHEYATCTFKRFFNEDIKIKDKAKSSTAVNDDKKKALKMENFPPEKIYPLAKLDDHAINEHQTVDENEELLNENTHKEFEDEDEGNIEGRRMYLTKSEKEKLKEREQKLKLLQQKACAYNKQLDKNSLKNGTELVISGRKIDLSAIRKPWYNEVSKTIAPEKRSKIPVKISKITTIDISAYNSNKSTYLPDKTYFMMRKKISDEVKAIRLQNIQTEKQRKFEINLSAKHRKGEHERQFATVNETKPSQETGRNLLKCKYPTTSNITAKESSKNPNSGMKVGRVKSNCMIKEVNNKSNFMKDEINISSAKKSSKIPCRVNYLQMLTTKNNVKSRGNSDTSPNNKQANIIENVLKENVLLKSSGANYDMINLKNVKNSVLSKSEASKLTSTESATDQVKNVDVQKIVDNNLPIKHIEDSATCIEKVKFNKSHLMKMTLTRRNKLVQDHNADCTGDDDIFELHSKYKEIFESKSAFIKKVDIDDLLGNDEAINMNVETLTIGDGNDLLCNLTHIKPLRKPKEVPAFKILIVDNSITKTNKAIKENQFDNKSNCDKINEPDNSQSLSMQNLPEIHEKMEHKKKRAQITNENMLLPSEVLNLKSFEVSEEKFEEDLNEPCLDKKASINSRQDQQKDECALQVVASNDNESSLQLIQQLPEARNASMFEDLPAKKGEEKNTDKLKIPLELCSIVQEVKFITSPYEELLYKAKECSDLIPVNIIATRDTIKEKVVKKETNAKRYKIQTTQNSFKYKHSDLNKKKPCANTYSFETVNPVAVKKFTFKNVLKEIEIEHDSAPAPAKIASTEVKEITEKLSEIDTFEQEEAELSNQDEQSSIQESSPTYNEELQSKKEQQIETEAEKTSEMLELENKTEIKDEVTDVPLNIVQQESVMCSTTFTCPVEIPSENLISTHDESSAKSNSKVSKTALKSLKFEEKQILSTNIYNLKSITINNQSVVIPNYTLWRAIPKVNIPTLSGNKSNVNIGKKNPLKKYNYKSKEIITSHGKPMKVTYLVEETTD